MKVSIITFHFVSNAGGVLQCLALQTFLKKWGHDVNIIDYRPSYHTVRYDIIKNPFRYSFWIWEKYHNKNTKRRILITGKVFFKTIAANLKKSDKNVSTYYSHFIHNYINLTDRYTSYTQLKNNPPLADAYITGSDQLWNPDLLDVDFDPAYFLQFGSTGMPKISYAVSTGKELNDAETVKLGKLADELTAVSVREYNAKVVDALGKDVHICIDPTLLLDAEDYSSVESDIVETEPYIFVYGFENTASIHDALEAAKEKYRCKVINGCPHRIKLGDSVQQLRDYGPDRFLTLIKNAQCVVTNSFHGTAFSIIYHKDFITVTHSTRGGRMTSLLYHLGLTSRLWGSEDFDFSGTPDFEEVERRRTVLRKYSSEFLLEALNGKHGEEIPHMPGEYEVPRINFKKLRKSTRYINTNETSSTKPLPELYEDSENCCGCTACYAICPVHAISMNPDDEGFLYPTVDAAKCIRCYKCLSVCAFKVDQEARGFLVREDKAND